MSQLDEAVALLKKIKDSEPHEIDEYNNHSPLCFVCEIEKFLYNIEAEERMVFFPCGKILDKQKDKIPASCEIADECHGKGICPIFNERER